MKVISILVVGDEEIPRVGLKQILASEPGFKILGESSSQDAIKQAKKLNPEVGLIHRGEPTSAQLVELVRNLVPYAAIIVLARDTSHVGQLFAAGAFGFVRIQAGAQELFNAIRAAARGQRFIDPNAGDEFLRFLAEKSATGPKGLSQREEQVLHMLAYGHTLKEIANELKISKKSIETYRARIREKLGLQTRADIVKYALDKGVLTTRKAG